jgi:ATP-binding cassette subfamily B protein
MSNAIAQATASYQRVQEVLGMEEIAETGSFEGKLSGKITMKNVQVLYGGKPALRDIDLDIEPGSRTAIIGPTAAGKTQLLYLLTGLIKPDSGEVLYDDIPFTNLKKESFYRQMGFVFQDSIVFNMTLRENIAFSDQVSVDMLDKAIETAELKDFVETLPEKLETVISERGTSLSGGQKQRVMLARALALNPGILLLDDFTARVDKRTERKIMENIRVNYPGITVLTVTQKIRASENFDQIILLMEGEVIVSGTHEALMQRCPEYVQIYNSQRSTSHYDLQS